MYLYRDINSPYVIEKFKNLKSVAERVIQAHGDGNQQFAGKCNYEDIAIILFEETDWFGWEHANRVELKGKTVGYLKFDH